VDKTAKYLLLITIALEAIGIGIVVTGLMSSVWGWMIAGLGVFTLLSLFVHIFNKPTD